jgi:hypothetical protein
MYKIVTLSPGPLLWRTPGPAALSAPVPLYPLLQTFPEPVEEPDDFVDAVVRSTRPVDAMDVPFGALVAPPDGSPPQYYADGVHFCRSHDLWLERTRPIATGEILYVRNSERYYVAKNQRIERPEVCFDATPGPCATELRALLALRHLMTVKRVAPVFCTLINHEVFTGKSLMLSTLMNAHVADVYDWVRGDGRDPTRACPHKPPLPGAADPSAPWILTRCAGHQLASSPHAEDRRLFSDILRAVVLQVLVGLAQGQRHCLFTHNDLHAGNVMFAAPPAGPVSRLFVTGCGTFLLPRRSPAVRIIDFQHACFDLYSSGGECVGRTAGYCEDVHNAYALVYDAWRFASHLTLELLRPYYNAVEPDLLALLRRAAQLPADGGPATRQEAELHWKPYLLEGCLPEDLLLDPAFDRYRCTPDTPADAISCEVLPSAEAQERYLRVRVLRHRGALNVPRDVAYAAFPAPKRVVPFGAAERLRTFAKNYEGTALGRALLFHKHTPAARARFLFMELGLLHAVLDHVWSEDCAQEVARRCGSDLEMCALADAVSVVLHSCWLWQARPKALEEYNERVRADARLPCVLRALARPVARTPLTAGEEASLLDVSRDADLERFRGVFVRAVEASGQ